MSFGLMDALISCNTVVILWTAGGDREMELDEEDDTELGLFGVLIGGVGVPENL